MDNAPNHSVRTEGTANPTSAWRKNDIKAWLDKHNIAYPPTALKPQLYEIAKLNKRPVEYEADTLIRAAGHDVLRLPAYHCSLNPIELIWANLKNRIALDNKTFKLKDVEQMVHDGFKRIDQPTWSKCVDHVAEVIEKTYWRKDGLIEVEPVIIEFDSSDDDTDDEF